jgi:hypothetical protein
VPPPLFSKDLSQINTQPELSMRMGIGVGLFPANTLTPLRRLHSLAFDLGTFAYAKDQASLPHNGLLKENPTQMRSRSIRVEHIHIIVSKLIASDNMVVATHGFSTIMTKYLGPRNI